MNAKTRRILVAVEHTDHMPIASVHKAAFLAKHSGARIELFHAIADLRPEPPSNHMTKAEGEDWKAAVASFRLRRLERFARSRVLTGLSVECTVVWEPSAYKAIVRQAIATHADLVIAGTHRHTMGARIVSKSVDWELIRQCPAPLLIVKSRRSYQDSAVVAAVDPFHANAKPADLDVRLLQIGHRFARAFSGNLHLFHAYMPVIPIQTLPMAPVAPLIAMAPELEPLHQEQVERGIDRLAQSARIPKAHRHLQLGHVVPGLSALTKQIRAGVVVMGAVSRSRIQRLLIGNTAERVLDDMPCDVLVVKPAGFKSKVLLSKHTPSMRLSGDATHSGTYA
jgi:universal stress protein E